MTAVAAPAGEYPGRPVIGFNHKDRVYRDNDRLVLSVANESAQRGYLYLDFVDTKDQVVHLFPTATRSDNLLQPGGRRLVGAADASACAEHPDDCFVVSRPHGNNLIIAIWSEAPLFSGRRLPQVESVDSYLARLRGALIDQAEHQRRHTVSYHFFTTRR